MINLIIFLLAGWGLTKIITDSFIFKTPRTLLGKIHPSIDYLVNCSQCSGFWVGLIFSLIPTFSFITLEDTAISYVVNGLVDGGIISGLCYFLSALYDHLTHTQRFE